jgi:hypothetical protein
MTGARRLFLVAGLYGLAVILPQFFLEARIGNWADAPEKDRGN